MPPPPTRRDFLAAASATAAATTLIPADARAASESDAIRPVTSAFRKCSTQTRGVVASDHRAPYQPTFVPHAGNSARPYRHPTICMLPNEPQPLGEGVPHE